MIRVLVDAPLMFESQSQLAMESPLAAWRRKLGGAVDAAALLARLGELRLSPMYPRACARSAGRLCLLA
jgi:hypothetical protein